MLNQLFWAYLTLLYSADKPKVIWVSENIIWKNNWENSSEKKIPLVYGGGGGEDPQARPLSWAQLAEERVEIPSDLTAHVMFTCFL